LVGVTRRLFEAARDRRIIEMRYFSAASNRSKSYTVQPYRLALAQGGLYLIAWVPPYDEFRTFASERIERLSVTEDTFKKTRDLPADLFQSSMGVFWGEPERIEILFAPRVAMVVRGRVWHESQVLEDQADGSVKMTLDVCNDSALRSWVLGFGSAVRVLQPPALVAAVADECRRAGAQY